MLFLKGLSLNLPPQSNIGSKSMKNLITLIIQLIFFSSEIDMSPYLPHVIILIGPTASGKTELAIEIAEYFKTHIHNIDSRQIYKSMDIGTAKPTKLNKKK